MATKKAASTAKKSTSKKSTAAKQSTTKVTTVKAVESRPATQTASATKRRSLKFGLSGTPLVAALVAEFIGTFALTAAYLATSGNPLILLFVIAGVVFTVGTISGGYANPAIILGAWVTRRMTGVRAIAYIAAQVLGAMLALVILQAYVDNAPAASSSLYGASTALFKAAAIPHNKEWFIFLSEFVGMLVYGFAFAGALREKKNNTVAIALTVGFGAYLGYLFATYTAGNLLGATAALNPAVAIALQAINFSSVWPILVYVIGAGLGGVIGFVLYDLVRGTEEPEEKAAF